MKRLSYGLAMLCWLSTMDAGKEIELKISLSDAAYAAVAALVGAWGSYRGYSEQTEYYLNKPDEAWDYSAGFKDTLRTLRIRCESKGDSVCYKFRNLDPITKKTTHRDEDETTVTSGEVMRNIFKNLGYTETTVIKKKRATYLMDNRFEVVFDTVEGIGKFIEIELKESINDVKVGIAAIESLMKELGISQFKQYDRGYIHMAWNPGYDFGEQRTL